MLDKESNMVLEFLHECRNHKMIQDELFRVEDEMYSNLYQVEEILSRSSEGRDMFVKLEQSIFDTLNELIKTYFEYGQHYGAITENQPIKNLIAG